MRILLFVVLSMMLSVSGCSLAVEKDRHESKESASNVSYKNTFTYTNQEFGYSLMLPAEWYEKFGVEEDKNVTRFFYKSIQHPDFRSDIFTIHTFATEQWEKVKDEPGFGQEIGRNGNYVYAYTVGLDNPYEGKETEEYRKLVQSVHLLMKDFKIEQK